MGNYLNPDSANFRQILNGKIYVDNLLKNKRGGGKLGLGLDDIRDSYVPIVSDSQVKNMVEEIEARLSVCDSIESTVNDVLQGLNAMRQSVL